MLKYQFFWNNSCQPPFNITCYFTMLHIRKYISLSILQYYILKSLGSSNHVKPRPTHNNWSNSGWHPMTVVCKSSQGFSLAAQVQNLRKNFFYRTEEAPASPSADERPSARVDRTCCALWVCPQQGTVGRVRRKQRAVVSEGRDRLHAPKVLETWCWLVYGSFQHCHFEKNLLRG